MRSMGRREFIGSATAGSAAWLIGRHLPALRAQTPESRIEVLVNEPIGVRVDNGERALAD